MDGLRSKGDLLALLLLQNILMIQSFSHPQIDSMTTRIESAIKASLAKKLVGSNCDLNPFKNGFVSMMDGFRTIKIDISLLKEEEAKEDSNPDVHNFHSRLSPRHYDWCIELLQSSSIDDNRKGLQLFSLLVKFKIKMNSPDAISNVAEAVVYGSDNVSTGEKLRDLLLTFVCDADKVEFDDDVSLAARSVGDSISCATSYSIDSLDDSSCGEDIPRGHRWGALHAPALRVVVNCLEQVVIPCESSKVIEEESSRHIEFSSRFWKNVCKTLSHNLEKGHSADISGYSLRLLRLLQKLEPASVNQLLQYSLLPCILELQQYGELHNYPMIRDETARIMKRLQG